MPKTTTRMTMLNVTPSAPPTSPRMPAAAAGSGVNRSRSERWFASRNPKTTISIEATAIRANPEIAAPNQPGEACRSPMGVNGDVLEATGMELPRDPKPLDRHSSLHLAGQLIRALIFDFDGLIIDTEEPIYRSWAEVYEAHGVPLPFDQWVKTVGSSNKEFDPQHHLEQQLGHPLAQGELDQRIQRRVELVLAQPLLPGVADLAGAARDRGLKVGVASSSSRDWVRGHLDRLGILDRFDCLRTRDDVEQVKPEPDLYVAVLDCLAIEELRPADVRGILPLGGTILGTSRTNPLKMKDGVATVIRVLRRHGVDAMVPIGGDDTLSVAAALHDAGFQTVGVPKTIDNDLSVTEFCIGFDTAVGVVTEALDRLHTTASAHHRVMVVEVMGRDTGWVALARGLAGGADLIIIPEFPLTLGDVVSHLYRRRGEGKLFSIIVVAEGAHIPELQDEAGAAAETDAFGHVQLAKRGIGDALARMVERETGFETRVTVLGHLQRGGSPTPTDRIWATRLRVHAVELIAYGKSGVILIPRHGEVECVAVADVGRETRRVPADLYQLTRVFE